MTDPQAARLFVVVRRLPPVLARRDYALLWTGQSVSVLGDGIYTIALALEALRISDHGSTLAYVEAARVAPAAALMLLTGALVDRLPRRLVVLTADTLRGVAVLAVTVLVAAHALKLGELVGLSALVGVGDAFFYPSYQAIMPEILPAELLTQGNAFNGASQTLGSSFVGPAVGGLIVAAGGTSAAFAVDAVTFGLSAVCLLLMSRIPPPARTGRSMLADVRAGLRWTRRQRWIWFAILAAGLANFAAFSPTAVTLPLIVRNVLHQGPSAYGATVAAGGVGGLMAAYIGGRCGTPRRRMSLIWAAWALASVALFGLGVAPDAYVAAGSVAVAFFGLAYGNLHWGGLMQSAVPSAILGRVTSVDMLFSFCLSPLGVIFAGALSGAIGARATVLLGAGLSLLSCSVVLLPGVRDPDRPDFRPADPD